MPLRYPNRGERELRYISTSSSPMIRQGMLPGARTISPPAFPVRQLGQRKPLGEGKGTRHRILSACYWNSECWRYVREAQRTSATPVLECLCSCNFTFFRQGIYCFITVLYLFSLELMGLSIRVSSSSIKPWASEAIRVTQHAGQSDYFKA